MVFFIHHSIAMNLSLTLFLIILNHAFTQPGDSGIRYEAWIDPDTKAYYCSAENDQDIAKLEEASKVQYDLKYCLFVKISRQPREKVCKKEINFLFHEISGENGGKCGQTSYQTTHAFLYNKCGDQSVLEKFRNENFQENPSIRSLGRNYNYRICYDTVEKKVLWTMHSFQSPRILRDSANKNQPELPAISTDPYFMNPNLFTTLKKKYAAEKKKKLSDPGALIMVPHPLVTPDHYAFRLTKISTNHYINMAPLWENLVPLMKAIDEGIKQAQFKLEAENPKSYLKLFILTNVSPSENVDKTSNTWFNLSLFQGNIWYKLVYLQNVQAAVMIIIHNTPGKPPSPSEGCLVGKPKKCKFEKWLKDESIIIKFTEYAFCCEITTNDINKIFSLSFVNVGYLNIHDLINKGIKSLGSHESSESSESHES